jgi:NADH-quinone oxidoreductase subunit C
VNRLSSTDAPAEEAPVRDDQRQGLLEQLRSELGDDAVVGTHLLPGDDLWVRVATEAWARAGEIARDRLGMDYFCYLSAIDWKPSPYGKGEDDPTQPPPERSTAVVQGYAGGNTRLQAIARVHSTRDHVGLTLKADIPDDTEAIETWVGNYAGANWHEREAWEMFGITFVGHPDLRHIYLPTDFEGFPLRKDFPLLARMVKPWPGIVDVEPMPAALDDETAEAPEPGDAEAATEADA